jgi:DNA-binding CsgD family transcriptional regulator
MAKEYFEEALPIHKEQNNLYSLAYSYNGLGEIARHEGRFIDAVASYRNAIALRSQMLITYERAGDTRRTLETLFPLAWEYQNLAAALYLLETNSSDESLACYKEALTLFRSIGFLPGTKPGIISCLGGLAALAARTNDYRTAATLFGASDTRLQGNARREPEVVLQPADLAHYNLVRGESLRNIDRIGRELWELAWRTGRRLTLEEAVAIALQERTLSTIGKTSNDLTARELEVLKLRAQGMTTGVILEQLVISKYTLVEHERKIRQKLGTKQMLAAITRARELGLLD